MVNYPYRSISEQEGELVTRVISFLPLIQQTELTKQIAASRVRTIEEYNDNYGSIEFQLPDDDRGHTMAVNAWAPDEDGVPIDVLLFVSPRGRLAELEIVRADGAPLRRMPAPDEFTKRSE